MKRLIILLAVLGSVMCATTLLAQTVRTGVSVTDGHLNNFYLSIGDYYDVPESRVVYVRDRYPRHDEELPVIFFLSSRAHVDPQVIIDLRARRRMSWLDITFHFGLSPEIYYVPVRRVGPPYGKAYGYYKKHGKDYKRVVLADDDVVNLVNLRFLSDYHGIDPELIMDRRGKGEKFIVMNDALRAEKKGHSNREKQKNGNGNKNDGNNGRGNGNRQG